MSFLLKVEYPDSGVRKLLVLKLTEYERWILFLDSIKTNNFVDSGTGLFLCKLVLVEVLFLWRE